MTDSRAWDPCGAPLVRLESGVWIHALPLTVYHLERYVWTAAGHADWQRILPQVRPRPSEARVENVARLWLTNVTGEEAADLAHWLGGRLPTRTEWSAAQVVWENPPAMLATLTRAPAGDQRVGDLVDRVAGLGSVRRSRLTPPRFADFATEFPRRDAGVVFLMAQRGSDGVVAGGRGSFFSAPDVGASCVFESPAMTSQYPNTSKGMRRE